jgi:hypothetical protein
MSGETVIMRWEYKSISIKTGGFLGGKVNHESLDHELNALGREGWEMVNAFDTNVAQGRTRDIVAIFKRNK